MLGLGPSELILIGLCLLFMFGAAKLPELARALGKAKAEFHNASRDAAKEIHTETKPLVQEVKA